VRDGKRLLEVFRSLGYPPAKVQVIVNRHEKKAQIKLEDLEKACATPVWRQVPNHYEAAAASVNQGIPVLKLSPKSPIAKSLVALARGIAGDAAPATTGWLARLLKKPAAAPQPAAVHTAPAQPALQAVPAAKQPAFEEKQVWMQKS
jgi:pilus assembly protein CpaE